MGKIRVLRGQVRRFSVEGATQLIQNDQRFTHGYRVKKFIIAYEGLHSSGAGTRDAYAVLCTHAEAVTPVIGGTVVEWYWNDRRQIAWSSTEVIGDSVTATRFELIDPTHIVVRDLYIAITEHSGSTSDLFNYYVELEEIDLTEEQAVLAIVQEESQDAGSAS